MKWNNDVADTFVVPSLEKGTGSLMVPVNENIDEKKVTAVCVSGFLG